MMRTKDKSTITATPIASHAAGNFLGGRESELPEAALDGAPKLSSLSLIGCSFAGPKSMRTMYFTVFRLGGPLSGLQGKVKAQAAARAEIV
ncbi:MAG TPA: hypothetical protein VGL87_04460 [Steroidobacteraceae bacterium]